MGRWGLYISQETMAVRATEVEMRILFLGYVQSWCEREYVYEDRSGLGVVVRQFVIVRDWRIRRIRRVTVGCSSR